MACRSSSRQATSSQAVSGARVGAAAVLALALSAAGPEAQAQLSPQGGPISYSADALDYFEAEKRMILTGNVEVVQDGSKLTAQIITIYFAEGSQGGPQAVGAGDITRMIADRDVYFVQPTQKARGDRAVYEVKTQSVTFTGDVVVTSDENVIRGDILVLNIDSGRTSLKPKGGPGARVQGVFRRIPAQPAPPKTP